VDPAAFRTVGGPGFAFLCSLSQAEAADERPEFAEVGWLDGDGGEQEATVLGLVHEHMLLHSHPAGEAGYLTGTGRSRRARYGTRGIGHVWYGAPQGMRRRAERD
jgi:hypothetical protein